MTKERAAFVGRDAQLAYLGGTLDRAIAGIGIAVLVAGEAVIGKTRRVDADGPDR